MIYEYGSRSKCSLWNDVLILILMEYDLREEEPVSEELEEAAS